jgi:hypothetical protein
MVPVKERHAWRVADGWRPHFRAPAPSTGSSVSRVARLAPVEVLERRRFSASADVLDGLGYWR